MGTEFRPLKGHKFHTYTDVMLRFVLQDAREACTCAVSMGDTKGESKYLDQINDAHTVLAYRARMAERAQYRQARA